MLPQEWQARVRAANAAQKQASAAEDAVEAAEIAKVHGDKIHCTCLPIAFWTMLSCVFHRAVILFSCFNKLVTQTMQKRTLRVAAEKAAAAARATKFEMETDAERQAAEARNSAMRRMEATRTKESESAQAYAKQVGWLYIERPLELQNVGEC